MSGPVFCIVSPGLLRFGSRDSRKIMPLAAALHRIVLAQRESREFIRHQDAPQVGMTAKPDAEHVIDFALQPLGAGPQRVDAFDLRLRLAKKYADSEAL